MRRDIQETEEFWRVSRFADWFRPGSGEVVDLVDPTLSPDGRMVAAAGAVCDSPRQDRLPRWSPDGRHIAFLSDRAAPFEFQLQAMDVASRAVREFRLAHTPAKGQAGQ